MCPECGERYDPNRVRAKWLHRRVSPDWLLVAAFLGPGLSPGSGSDRVGLGLLFSTIVTLAPWLWINRGRLFVQLGWRELVPAGQIALWFLVDPMSIFVTTRVVLMVVVGLWILRVVIGEERPRMLSLVYSLCGSIAVAGAVATADGVVGKFRYDHWSPYDDTRPGQLAEQYPLTIDEAMSVAVPVLLASMAGVVLALVMDRRRGNGSVSIGGVKSGGGE